MNKLSFCFFCQAQLIRSGYIYNKISFIKYKDPKYSHLIFEVKQLQTLKKLID